jgi:uncharacterized repeat protein (TIGR03803 family)
VLTKKLIPVIEVSVLVFAIVVILESSTFAASGEEVLYAFQAGKTGYAPVSNLVFDKKGHLYGTTFYGGSKTCAGGCGTVFELTRGKGSGWAEMVLYAFHGRLDGQNPAAGLVLDKAGNLYGTTVNGGRSSFGSVFKLSPMKSGRWKETTLHNFTGGHDGGHPYAGLIFDDAGRLFGTTFSGGDSSCDQGCGTVFELSFTHKRWKETVLYSPSSKRGQAIQPYDGLTFDSQGSLYGTSSTGGECCGTVFRLTPSRNGKWSMSVLHNFTNDGHDGYSPFGGVVLNKEGNIFGTTVSGGLPGCLNQEGCGTVFQLTHTSDGGWKESILHRFTGGKDGANPFGDLTIDPSGDLLGTTWGNGIIPCGVTCGTAFRLSTSVRSNRHNLEVLYRFKGTDGGAPDSSLILDPSGNLYGTTQGGGAFGDGVVFEIKH